MRQKFTTLLGLVSLFVLLLGSTWSMAQDKKTVSGTVLDEEQNPLPGVSYLVKGTNNGGATDVNGKFTVSIGSSSAVMVFSSIGYVTKEVAVGNASILTVNLAEDLKTLNEVVVTGFGMATETRKLTYSAQTVEGKDLTRTNNANLVNALQGKVAGVMINQGASGPMSSSRIRIRGNASLSSNTQPLFVVDGVLIRPGTTGADSWGGAQDFGNIMKNINPDNIESMSVLKGSAASSLYGSEALNGVVLIQTKKGRETKGLGVSYNHSSSFEKAYRIVDLQNQFGAGLSPTFEKDANGVDMVDANNWFYSYGPEFNGQQVKDLDGRMIEWKANDPISFFNTGKYINHNIAVDGGNERSSFRVSYSNLFNSSVMPSGTEMKRNNFNIRATQKIGKIIDLDVSADYTSNNLLNPTNQGSSYNPVFKFVYYRPRSLDIDYWMNNYIDPNVGGRRRGANDPYSLTDFMWEINERKRMRNEKIFRGNIDLKAQITPWLTGLLRSNLQNEIYTGEYLKRGDNALFSGNDEYSTYATNNNQYRVQGLFTANKSFGSDFETSLTVGGETNKINGGRQFTNGTSGGLRIPEVYSLSNSINVASSSASLIPSKRTDAVYAYGDVTYKGLLTLNASYRRDWTSTLTYKNGTGDWSYDYPSVGLSWIATESFKDTPNWLSFGKVRASFGYTGGDTDAWSTNRTGIYNPSGNYTLPDGSVLPSYGFRDRTLPNANLKNRLAREIEFGTDIRFFKNRLGIDFTFYNKLTTNEILTVSVPSESGLTGRIINAGKIRNRGIEILLTANPIKTDKFNWNTTFNFSRNRNKILELVDGVDSYELSLAFGADVRSIARVGGDYGTISSSYAYALYQAKDASGAEISSPSNGQRVIGASSNATDGYPTYLRSGSYGQGSRDLGTMLEKFLLSNSNSVSYGDFNLSVQVDAKIGGLMASGTHQYGSSNGSLKNSLPGRNAALGGVTFTDAAGNTRDDGIIPEGVLADGYKVNVDGTDIDLGGMQYSEAVANGYLTPIPAYAYYENLTQWGSGIREYSVFENSWVSLREVSVGYTVPANIINKYKIQSLRVGLVGRNLTYLYMTAKDGINPEGLKSNRAGEFAEYGGAPFTRNLGFSINVGF
ncbi:iron complex outermembrane receptor protein [Dyadobacter jejuensis]|uniref:Iron complex outermembrane receptor protein n=1 Tax=Dyadobacter jejuensis TaxID=1082580 RepID=A0A316AQT4_9BACT|nr:SusC/RagA family TonB-linked outer membrane protein [Dyadobacter jejuensis]PWJ60083.1 iron complex outermembrane receptor protein [Dyadobacter jejuensis]